MKIKKLVIGLCFLLVLLLSSCELEDDMNANFKEIENKIMDLDSKNEELKNDYESQIELLKDQHEKEIEALKENYDKQIKDLNNELITNKEELKKDYDSKIEELTDNYEKEIAFLKENITKLEEVKKYKVTFVYDNGEEDKILEVEENTKVSKPENPTKIGYTFDGWVDDANEKWVFGGYIVTEDITLRASWTINMYSIIIKDYSDGNVLALNQLYNSEIKINPPTKIGYTFKEWSIDVPEFMPAYNLKFEPIWTACTYKINYDLDGGILPNEIVTEYTIEDEITLPQPTKEGYVFTGWTGTDLTRATINVTISRKSTGERNYKATWIKESCAVTLNCGRCTYFHEEIAASFIEDFNEFSGKNVTKETFFDLTYSSMGTQYVMNFFNDGKYQAKWAWLLNYINEIRLENSLCKLEDAGNAQQRGDIHNWLNHCAQGENGGVAGYGQDFSNINNYRYVLTSSSLSYTLPSLTLTDYTFLGWYDNGDYEGNPVTIATNGQVLYAKWEKK